MENNQTKKKLTEQRKHRGKIITWAFIAMVVLLLAVMPVLAAEKDAAQEQQASILSGTVEYGSIDTQIIGGGQLASESAVKLKIPEEVKLTEYLVGNGDTVTKGEAIAGVDRVSVMTAIAGVQETLDDLSKAIADAENDEASDTLKAKAGGRVKVIWAEAGESVQEVMLEHGALAAVSLDGLMAVKIQRVSDLDAGDPVCVTFPDGTGADGRVEQNLEGVLTITVEDDDYAVGTEVTVMTEDGGRLGRGTLYIFNQWNVVAYSGTVSDILVSEGASLRSGQAIIRLEDSGHTAEFQRLIDQRHEYEVLMQELFRMYRTETITAPCDGIVSGVDKDGAFVLSEEGEGFILRLLTNLASGRRELFEAYGVRVETVTSEGMLLQVNAKRSWVEDLSDLSAVSVDPGKMSQQWNYTGDTTVYVQSEDGLLHADGTARPGDILLAVGDAESVLWFVRTETAKERGVGSGGVGKMTLLADSEEEMPVCSNGVTECPVSAGMAGHGENCPYYQDLCYGPLGCRLSIDSVGHQYGCTKGLGVCTANNHCKLSPEAEGHLNGCPYGPQPELGIMAENIPDGMVGTEYRFTLTASGSDAGVWMAENLPGGLVLNMDTGEISGTPIASGEFTVKVMYMDLASQRRVEKEYSLCIANSQIPQPGGNTPDSETQEGEVPGGSMPSAGMTGGMMTGGIAQGADDGLYSLEELTIASVTSQEHMTVEITIDELDISKVYVGQGAAVTVDALAGEKFAATVTGIANSGENEGGNSKFAVELTLEKSGGMLPGMTASARIVPDTVDDVLCIPVAALNEENGKPVVYTSWDSEAGVPGTPVEITIGAADADNVQILTGLEAGDVFYYAYYDAVSNVSPVDAAPF